MHFIGIFTLVADEVQYILFFYSPHRFENLVFVLSARTDPQPILLFAFPYPPFFFITLSCWKTHFYFGGPAWPGPLEKKSLICQAGYISLDKGRPLLCKATLSSYLYFPNVNLYLHKIWSRLKSSINFGNRWSQCSLAERISFIFRKCDQKLLLCKDCCSP